MTTETLAIGVVEGIVAASIYATLFYAKKRTDSGLEVFNARKFAATLIVGALVGAGLWWYGLDVTEQKVETVLAMNVGTVALVEAVLKWADRTGRRFRAGRTP